MAGRVDTVLRTAAHRRFPRATAVIRVIAGVLFAVFGVPKFTDHRRWVSDFGTWSLPESSLLVYGTGVVEVLGGAALVLAVGGAAGTRVVAGVLALVMAGATLFGGILGGNPGSLSLAPALLVASVFVAWSTIARREPGRTGPPGAAGPDQRRRSSS